MLRLTEPTNTFENSIDDCASGIASHLPLRAKLIGGKAELMTVGEEYVSRGRAEDLSAITRFAGDGTAVVVGGLTKSELIKVYDQYFVPRDKVARRVYDAIMASALERCPFCGGIGTPHNLDHYLPKAHFPQFSFLPLNLVPACRDCNMGEKGASHVASKEDQLLHPYLDNPLFFEEQWVFAMFHEKDEEGPARVDYFAEPPQAWPPVAKARAIRHFSSFNLARRYAIKAAEHLGTVLEQIAQAKYLGINPQEIRKVIIEPGMSKAPFKNHWRHGLYQSLGSTVVDSPVA